MAQSFGAYGITVNNDERVEEQVAEAMQIVSKDRKTVVMHVITDPAELNP